MNHNHQKIKKEFNKAYLPIIFASIILILLIIFLIFAVIYLPEDNADYLKAPKFKEIEVGMVNGTDTEKMKSLRNVSKEKKKVKFSVVKELYRNDVFLMNYDMNYIEEDGFFIISNDYDKNKYPFISKIDFDGKFKWITKFNTVKYSNLKLFGIYKHEDSYYVVATGEKNERVYLLGIKMNQTGEIEKVTKITSEFDGEVYKTFQLQDKIVIMTTDTIDVMLYFIDYNMKLSKEKYNYSDNSIFVNSKINAYDAEVEGNNLIVLLKATENDNQEDNEIIKRDNLTTNDFILNVNLNNLESKIYPVNGISSKLENYPYYKTKIEGTNVFYQTADDVIDVYLATNGSYIKTLNYSTLELEDINLYPVENGVKNNEIDVFDINDNMVILNTYHNRVYDYLDLKANITKREIIDFKKFEYRGSLIKVFHVNDKIYEIYTYGTDVSCLLIGIVG